METKDRLRIDNKSQSESKLKNIFKGCALVISIAAYPVLFVYFQNIEEVDFIEVWKVLFYFVIVALAVYSITSLVFRRLGLSAVIASLFLALLLNYMIIQKGIQLIFSSLKYWHILPIILVVIAHIFYFLRKISEEHYSSIILIIQITIGGLILINAIPAIPHIITKVKIHTEQAKMESQSEETGQGSNVYWFIFDECASFATMEKYYDYGDKTVFDALQELEFTISDDSRNESGNTVSVLTNCLNLEYVANSSMDAAQLETLRKDNKLVNIFKDNGYQIKGIGDTGWLGIQSVNQTTGTAGKTIEGKQVSDLIMQNTVLAPFVQFDGTAEAKIIMETFEYMQDSDNIQANTSQLNIIYLCTPHQPFLFDKDGGAVSAANYANWDDERYYLGQYIFVMNQMLKSVKNIVENDPDSIIVVQSDHGPRFNNEMPYEDKINILNAVYFKGEEISEVGGKSGVNTLRTVCNRLFGYDLQDLEVKDGE